ncbi:MAG: hypothetical protein ACFFDI_31290 [Promethearchaeota archaeon]
MSKTEFILIIVVVSLIISNFLTYNSYSNISQEYSELDEMYNKVIQEKNELNESFQEFRNDVFYRAEDNYTTVTIAYFTNFSQNQQIISLSVSYEKYDAYHKKHHPYWGENNLTSAIEYITSNETVINQIVETIRNQTKSEEELANAILSFVQDKGGLSIRYYPTTELKYPIETLVEMGGDCDTHSFLYGTLMKAAGFKVLILLSNETLSDGLFHAATAIHLKNPPQNSLSKYDDYSLFYNGEEYYYAETTHAHWRVGDLPPWVGNVTFNTVPI